MTTAINLMRAGAAILFLLSFAGATMTWFYFAYHFVRYLLRLCEPGRLNCHRRQYLLGGLVFVACCAFGILNGFVFSSQ